GWSPAAGFDHRASRFPLTGKHEEVGCKKCHPSAIVDGAPLIRYSGTPFSNCADCHDDPHAGRLGSRCADCHSTSSWRTVPLTSFSHEITRFPLRGRHAGLPCESCHQPGESRAPLPFARCSDCHTEFHGQADPAGQFSRCEECHDLAGFSPSTFTIARHDSSSFPLRGAHLAVPCFVCHQTKTTGGAEAVKLQVPGEICVHCHDDPHRGELIELVRAEGCEVCHSTSDWSTVTFDHQRTRFPLTGGHRQVACTGCHPRLEADGSPYIRYRPVTTACDGCHQARPTGNAEDQKP
ncbi:MAG: cytochrome C, partial [bacterium]